MHRCLCVWGVEVCATMGVDILGVALSVKFSFLRLITWHFKFWGCQAQAMLLLRVCVHISPRSNDDCENFFQRSVHYALEVGRRESAQIYSTERSPRA